MKIKWIVIILFIQNISVQSFDYLTNQIFNKSYHTVSSSWLLTSNSYPSVGLGCAAVDENNNVTYYTTTTYQYNSGNNQATKCSKAKRHVEIIKISNFNQSVLSRLLIGDSSNGGVGEKGSDDITSCGFSKNLNIFYYIGADKYNCGSTYHTQSSIVLIDTVNFDYSARIYFSDITNIPAMSTYSSTYYTYLRFPMTSVLDKNNNLYIGFGYYYTGIIKFKLTNNNLVYQDHIKKQYQIPYANNMGLGMEGSNQMVTYNFQNIYFSGINKKENKVYFIDDSGYRDAALLKIDLNNFIDTNTTTSIHVLEGISYINDFKINNENGNVYILAGQLSSTLYQLDSNLKRIKLEGQCGKDSISFEPDYGIIRSIVLDPYSHFLYLIVSERFPYGIIKIKSDTLEFDPISDIISFDYTYTHTNSYNNKVYNYQRYYYYTNITAVSYKTGKLMIGSNYYGNKPPVIVSIDLLGCIPGTGIQTGECSDCIPGKYSDITGAENCFSCNVGYYSNFNGSKSCLQCIPGKFSSDNSSIMCSECTEGKYSSSYAQKECSLCPSGKYTGNIGSNSEKSCKKCNAGSVSMPGSSSCISCVSGKYSSQGEKCVVCPKGKYNNLVGKVNLESCIDCPFGKFSNMKGSSSIVNCLNCPLGKYNPVSGSASENNCLSCIIGKYRSILMNPSEECRTCPSGKISEESASNCLVCPSGKYEYQNKQCKSCPKGKYNNLNEQSSIESCKNCMKGKYSNIEKSNTETNCISCVIGTYNLLEGSVKNTSCISCIAGKFRSEFMDPGEECQVCTEGKISNISSSECIICSFGTYEENRFSCKKCPGGKYNDILQMSNLESCKDCSKGKYSNYLGSITESNCNICLPGKYNPNIGSSSNISCIKCSAGFFRSENMNPGENCQRCPIGKISTISSYICQTCLSGKYEKNFIECLKCEKGKYKNSDMVSNNCQVCENGKYSSINGEKCLDCIPGKYSDGNLASDHILCKDCPAGKYSKIWSARNIDLCLDCSAGKYSGKNGANNSNYCILCENGKYNNKFGSVKKKDCTDCPVGKYRKEKGAVSVNECRDCGVGKYSPQGSQNCTLCPLGTYNNLPDVGKCKRCSENTIANSIGLINCENCIGNSISNNQNTRCLCKENFYTVYENSGKFCTPCLESSKCGRDIDISGIELEKGFWRHHNKTKDILECRAKEACIGGIIQNSSNELCREGQLGPLCDVCKKGYAKSGDLCAECPEYDRVKNSFIALLAPLILAIVLIFLIKNANPDGNSKDEISGVSKILMNYLQVFSLASNFDINWPSSLKNMYDVAEDVSSPKIGFYSSDCSIGWDFFDKFIIYVSMPIIYMVFSVIVLGCSSCCYHKKRIFKRSTMPDLSKIEFRYQYPTSFSFFKGWMKTTAVVGLFLMYPSIIKNILTLISCIKIGDNHYLNSDLSIMCYTEEHNYYRFVAYIFLFLYGFGIPSIGFLLLYKYRNRLFINNSKNRFDSASPLSFLFIGYREDRYYWEFIIMARKLGVIFMSVFLQQSSRYQMIFACWLVQTFLVLHIYFRPYDMISNYGKLCNRLESVSLLSLVFTLNSGLVFGTKKDNYQLGIFELILVFLVIIVNIGVMIYFCYWLIVTGTKSGKEKIQKMVLLIVADKDKKPRLIIKFLCCLICFPEIGDKIIKWACNDISVKTEREMLKFVRKKIYKKILYERSEKTKIVDDCIIELKDNGIPIGNNKTLKNKKTKKIINQIEGIHSSIEMNQKDQVFSAIKYNKLLYKISELIDDKTLNTSEKYKKHLQGVLEKFIEDGKEHIDTINEILMEGLDPTRVLQEFKKYKRESWSENVAVQIKKIQNLKQIVKNEVIENVKIEFGEKNLELVDINYQNNPILKKNKEIVNEVVI